MISFIADVHIGNHKKCGGPLVGHINTRCLEVITSLESSIEIESDALIILGDLFDKHSTHPAILKSTGEALKNSKPIYILAGNHDVASSHYGDSAISCLDWIPNIKCYTNPTVLHVYDTPVLMVPFIPGNMATNVKEILEAADYPDGTIMAAHFGISDESTPPWLLNTESAVSIHTVRKWVEKYKLGGVFVGDWHNRHVWGGPNGEPIVQVGALVPTGWDNPGHEYGHVTVLTEDGELDNTQIPGPRFFDVWSEGESEDILKALNKNSARLKIKSELLSDAYIAELADDENVLDVIFDISIDASRESAESAVKAVRNGTKAIDELVATYIDGMDLSEERKREVVTSTLAYLNKAVG